MSDRRPTSISPDQPLPPEPSPRGKRTRLRRFFLRHLPLSLAAAAVLLALAAVAAYFIASSATFENLVRKRLIAQIETVTGGRTQIASFHWRLLHLEAEADGVVIHGTEDPSEAPYAQIDRLRVQMSIFGFLTPHISLRDLEIVGPRLHLIVYRDGSTNQPRPLRPRKRGKSAVDTLFDLRASQITVEQGMLDYDDRAATFDARNRYLPLDFKADDVSLEMIYVPGWFRAPESYRVNAAAEDLVLARQLPRKQAPPVHGKFQLALEFQRHRVSVRSFQLTAHSRGDQDRVLQVTGTLDDFTHPRWQAKIDGDLDMRLLEPVTGYADSPDGIAHLHLTAGGVAPAFQIAGSVHVDGGSYIGAGMNATGVNLDARIDADRGKLLITQIVARMRQGGQIEGSVALEPWLPGPKFVPAQITAPIGAPGSEESRRARNVLVRAAIIPIPVNGKVAANFKGVSLDTVLDIVCPPPYRRLGFDARVNGPASATWSNGDARTIAVSSTLVMSPSQQTPAGEAPATGVIDATYTQRNGGVDLRDLELHLPASEFVARGSLGAYPVTSASALTVDFHSHDLSEFDTVLRSLGLSRNGKSGTAALPVSLTGQADFRGSWTGSLIKPHIAGTLKATQLAVEIPSEAGDSNEPRLVHFDSVRVEGSYAPTQISIQHAQLLRGDSRIALSGTLDTAIAAGTVPRRRSAGSPQPAYDGDSVLRAHVDAANIDVADLQPFFDQSLPVTGSFDAQFTADGPLRAPAASGSAQMDRGVVYGEPVTQIHVQAAMADHRLKVVSARATDAGGVLTASGSYDFNARTFDLDAHGSQIEIARVTWVDRHNLEAAGKLSIDLTSSGSLDDPRLNARATVESLALGGQQFGAFEVSAQTAGHNLTYDATTQLQGADLHLKGQTVLRSGYATQARVDFSQFNVGALLRMAHVGAFSADSALAGTISIDGPLSDLKKLRGDAQLRQLAVKVAGVHLQSESSVHATLADGRVRLDPLHVTGDNTDLRAEGSLSLEGSQQLDLAASGSVNLKLAETLDPDLTASGVTTFQLEAHGPLRNPGLQGSVEFQNGSLSLEDLPNGLSQLRGTLEFNQNRLEVKSLTAMTGGGQLTVEGYLAYERGIFADLTVTGKSVHIRYPAGVSSLADLRLQLQGPQSNLLLSGDVLITRFAVSPDLDLAALAIQAATSVQSVAPPDAPSNHVRLDVHIVSSPQLNFQNAFAKLAGDVNLRLRGTLASPSLLGGVSITEGSALIAGTRYDLERGDITFTNPVRIEPVIDLSATAHVEDYDISLGLHGSPQKLSVTYRSDPPLPEADVVALLALGHTANQQRLYTQQQEQAISNPTTDALLGGALNATVSSRIQKLFGAGSVKIDPNYLGAFGNSTSRITVEEQLGRNVTLTYATDVNTTSQQLLQAEVAINRHVSLVVARDESGVFSMVVKATRRYR
ncbi:MAG: translocation/assembly module TamB domain-containing protein [Terracidiphilus sp.]